MPAGIDPAEHRLRAARMPREARNAAALDHRNIVTVFNAVECENAPFLVLELVRGPSPAQVVAEDGPLIPARTAEIGLMVLDALCAAHRAGIVHRCAVGCRCRPFPSSGGRPSAGGVRGRGRCRARGVRRRWRGGRVRA
ncbi:hypothetical protein K1Y72_30460 [Actinomadura sp. PM05-2]|uniref:Protein kinase domain-containing protein n=1 Tax=Actinomadura parmotrematis TaxID=2864039 RepID=A0ABS7G1Y5_9ACTN|nr:hypothetical protein [Actinomadura parmotrematis]